MNIQKYITEFPIWATAGLTILTIVLAAILNELLFKTFDLYIILLATGLVILSSIMGAVVARFTASQQIIKAEEEFKKVKTNLDSLDNAIKSAQDITRIAIEKFGRSIITYRNLMEIESKVDKNGEIWVLTSALELEDTELKEIIRANLKNKIKYTYFIPDGDKLLKTDMIRISKQWKADCNLSEEEAKQQIKCYLVPKHFVYMTVIIYNAHNKTKTNPPTVVVKFPTSHVFEKEKYPLIYRVDTEPEEAWKTFLSSMMDFIDEPICKAVKELQIDFSNTVVNKR